MKWMNKATTRKWARYKDDSTPQQRKLLDRLEKYRSDMAPLKLSGTTLVTACRTFIGCYGSGEHILEWARREIKRVQGRNYRDRKKLAKQQLGAFI